MAYHVNPETGRVNVCKALERCRFGPDAAHAATAELVRIHYEETQQTLVLPAPLTRSASAATRGPQLTPTETALLTHRLRRQLMTDEFKRVRIDGHTEVEVVLHGRNGTASFDYTSEGNERTFMYGSCSLLAHAIHEKTGLPLTVVTMNPGQTPWAGHVAVQVGEDSFLDITGTHSMASIKKRFAMKDVTVETNVDLPTFYARMDTGEDQIRSRLDGLEQAIVDRLARDLVRDFVE